MTKKEFFDEVNELADECGGYVIFVFKDENGAFSERQANVLLEDETILDRENLVYCKIVPTLDEED
jgi:hypothetical protein